MFEQTAAGLNSEPISCIFVFPNSWLFDVVYFLGSAALASRERRTAKRTNKA
jgi:hypothetical protein